MTDSQAAVAQTLDKSRIGHWVRERVGHLAGLGRRQMLLRGCARCNQHELVWRVASGSDRNDWGESTTLLLEAGGLQKPVV
jgi:hypothetical protein